MSHRQRQTPDLLTPVGAKISTNLRLTESLVDRASASAWLKGSGAERHADHVPVKPPVRPGDDGEDDLPLLTGGRGRR